MSKPNFTEVFLKQALESTINKLSNSKLGTPPVLSSHDPSSQPPASKQTHEQTDPDQPAPEKEKAAFEEPSQEDTDELQNLELATVRFKLEREEIETGKLREQVEGLKAQNRNHNAIARGRKIDNRLRLQMAGLTFKFMQFWCSFVALIVFIYVAKKDGAADPSVIIALLGTSTISIVGLVGFVVSGLFKSSPEKDKSDKDKKD
ncbi:hypothetical protein N5E15_09380 [Pantoea stewartii]|uniref:hypothetical protein n=1 Tax=Pantoea stewartii TaxID=66269 RepID=UPI0021D4B985|nr:hypothetical protein [Pantoea stewartii]MCU7366813.1 hypothetical protein [Pantoea stewartii]